MTEKVVHEWKEDGGWYQIHGSVDEPFLYVVEHAMQSPCQFLKEMARLAARVEELERRLNASWEREDEKVAGLIRCHAENARLREALEKIAGADHFGAGRMREVAEAVLLAHEMERSSVD